MLGLGLLEDLGMIVQGSDMSGQEVTDRIELDRTRLEKYVE